MTNSIESALFDASITQNWQMQNGERAAIIHALTRFKPDISLEIGTFLGGSLRPIAAASNNVFTFDIDDRAFAGLDNVRFITGNSSETLPPIIDMISSSDREINFILIDGDHSESGVRKDIINCLKYVPKTRPTAILMHDSSNPSVRRGIATAPWESSPFVHDVDLDYVHGLLFDRPDIAGQIWGGLALAVMYPTPREGALTISRGFEPSLKSMISSSIYA